MKKTTTEMEIRAHCAELRADKDTGTITGYAAVFDQSTSIGGYFDEVIRPGAFARAISEAQDVRALIDHDRNKVIGRVKSGTLRMREDDHGLAIDVDLADTQESRDLRTKIERGDIDGMSFGFWPTEVRWTAGEGDANELREILDLDLVDVSVVTFPAYDGTSVAVRSADVIESIIQARNAERAAPGEAQRKANHRTREIELALAELGPGNANRGGTSE